MIRLGVTGTDTGVGKTVVACAIVASLRARGVAVGALKPLETGIAAGDETSDAARLARAAGDAPAETLAFTDPVAPLVAARRAQREIDIARLDDAFENASRGRDAIVVEGAGGLLVPIAPSLAFDGLFKRWCLDVVLVGANRLGVLNHALLTLAAARAASLRVRAIVLNRVAVPATDVSIADNAAILRELAAGVPVIEFPWVADPSDLESLVAAAERAGLIELLSS